MKKNMLHGGLWPVMITPFTDKNTVDITALEELVEFYLRTGSSGLFANCLSSEMFQLSEEERILITKTIVNKVDGRVPVISTGTFSSDENKNIEFFNKVFDLGVHAVVINSNQLVSEEAPENIFKLSLESLMNRTGNIPLGIYECPVPYKRLLSPSILKWMADSGRFLYFKDTCCDNQQIEEKLKAVQGTNFSFFNANIPTALNSLQKGARGLSAIGANYIPELYAFLSDNFNDAGRKNLVEKVSHFLSVIDPLVHLNYPFAAKWFLQQRGLKLGTYTRTPYAPMQSQDYLRLLDLLHISEEIMQEIH